MVIWPKIRADGGLCLWREVILAAASGPKSRGAKRSSILNDDDVC